MTVDVPDAPLAPDDAETLPLADPLLAVERQAVGKQIQVTEPRIELQRRIRFGHGRAGGQPIRIGRSRPRGVARLQLEEALTRTLALALLHAMAVETETINLHK